MLNGFVSFLSSLKFENVLTLCFSPILFALLYFQVNQGNESDQDYIELNNNVVITKKDALKDLDLILK